MAEYYLVILEDMTRTERVGPLTAADFECAEIGIHYLIRWTPTGFEAWEWDPQLSCWGWRPMRQGAPASPPPGPQ